MNELKTVRFFYSTALCGYISETDGDLSGEYVRADDVRELVQEITALQRTIITQSQVRRSAEVEAERLSHYEQAWDNLRHYFEYGQIAKDYPYETLSRNEAAAIVSNLMDEYEKDMIVTLAKHTKGPTT